MNKSNASTIQCQFPLCVMGVFIIMSAAQADDDVPESYMLSGTCLISGASEAGRATSGLLAIVRTPDRIAVCSQGGRPGMEARTYVFATKSMSHACSLNILNLSSLADSQNLFNLSGIEAVQLVQQSGLPIDPSKELNTAVDFGIGVAPVLHFGYPRYDASLKSLTNIQPDSNGTRELSNDFGRMTVDVHSDRIEFAFIQNGNNLLSLQSGDQTVADFKTPSFPDGVSAINHRTRLETSFEHLKNVPWNAVSETETIPVNGKPHMVRTEIRVTEFTNEAEKANQFLDKLLAAIPDHTRVVTEDKLVHEFVKGEVATVRDESALQNAERLNFVPPATSSWSTTSLIPAIVGFLSIATAAWFWYKRSR